MDSQQFPMKRDSIAQSFNAGKIDMFQSNTSSETMAGRHLCIICQKTFMTSGGLYKHKKIAHVDVTLKYVEKVFALEVNMWLTFRQHVYLTLHILI